MRTSLFVLHHSLEGVTGEYQSPARTATHIHEAEAGSAGPPRLAFPNPTGDDWKRTSFGCLQGPFTTGLNGTNGRELSHQTHLRLSKVYYADEFSLSYLEDTGTGFSLTEIEANPSGFFADVHTATYVAGAVRGQLEKKDW